MSGTIGDARKKAAEARAAQAEERRILGIAEPLAEWELQLLEEEAFVQSLADAQDQLNAVRRLFDRDFEFSPGAFMEVVPEGGDES